MGKLTNNQKIVAEVLAVLLGIYLLLSFIVAFVNVQNTMNWCQFKNGQTYWGSDKQEPNGKRWSPNPMTIGLTGECINPGDRGL